MRRAKYRRAVLLAVAISAVTTSLATGQEVGPALVDSSSSRGGPTITLDEAIARAQRVQPTVVRAISGVNSAEHQKRSASIGSWLPSISASSSGSSTWNEGIARIDPNTGIPLEANAVSRTVGFGLSGSWDVFTGFARGAESREAKANLNAADADLIEARYQIAFQTKQQFYGALSAEELQQLRDRLRESIAGTLREFGLEGAALSQRTLSLSSQIEELLLEQAKTVDDLERMVREGMIQP